MVYTRLASSRRRGSIVGKPDAASRAFVSGPLDPGEMDRLLERIDERLRLREALDVPLPADVGRRAATEPRVEPGAPLPDPALALAPDALDDLEAPFFHLRRAGRLSRLAKRALNAPLRLFARPQAYFNDVVRDVARSWGELLRASFERQAVLERELAAQRRRIDELGEAVARLGAAAGAGGLRVQLGADDLGAADHLRVDTRERPGTHLVVRDLGALPFARASIAELLVTRVADAELSGRLAHWRSLLVPGGCLRIVCADSDARAALPPLLEAAGFRDCRLAGPGATEVQAWRPPE
jgi:hypothetical protein